MQGNLKAFAATEAGGRGRGRGTLGRVFRAVLVLALLTFSVLFGRPFYWGLVSRLEPDDDGGEAEGTADAHGRFSISVHKDPRGVAVRPRHASGPAARSSSTSNSSSGAGTRDGQDQPAATVPSQGNISTVTSSAAAAAATTAAAAAAAETGSPRNAQASAASEVPVGGFARGVRAIIHEGRPLLGLLKRPVWEQPSPGTEFPGKAEFALRREMAQVRATQDGFVLVTFANYAFMDFVINWVQHLTEQGVGNILVGAMDEQLLRALFFRGVPVFDMESGLQAEDAGWGSPVFHKMGREKVTLVNVFLAMGFSLLICDTDAVFLRDPLPYMRRFPDADLLMSSDHLARTVDNDDLEDYTLSHGAYNIGILLFHPTEAAKRFARQWSERLAGDDSIWDQNGFNDEMRKKLGPAVEGGSSKHLFYAFDGTLKAGILPVSLFCSGHTYFIQRLYSVVKIPAYAIHTTFQFSGTPGKRHRLREAIHFRDAPEYYDPPGGVISFSAKIPPGLLHGGNHSLDTHFLLMNYQIRQLRVMMALAILLNRTLVFPEIWARYDSQYFPHAGIVEKTDTAQPLIVPMDHLFQVDKMLPGVMPESDMGPAFRFREYSFLDNPAVLPQFKASKVTVILCRGTEPVASLGSQDPSSAAAESLPGFTSRAKTEAAAAAENLLPCSTRLSSPNQVLLRLGASTSEIKADLLPLKGYKWMEFESHVEHLIGSWDDKVLQEKFYRRLKHTVGIWCCMYAHPGHVYYDVFADQKPGWRPKPPANPSEDHPPLD